MDTITVFQTPYGPSDIDPASLPPRCTVTDLADGATINLYGPDGTLVYSVDTEQAGCTLYSDEEAEQENNSASEPWVVRVADDDRWVASPAHVLAHAWTDYDEEVACGNLPAED